MKERYRLGMVLVASIVFGLNAWAEMPKITGNPVIDTPQLLEWPADRGMVTPNLNDPTSNILFDLHGIVSSCDLVLSTEGNHHPGGLGSGLILEFERKRGQPNKTDPLGCLIIRHCKKRGQTI